jgi:lactoylglutathione lyase
MNKLNYSIVVVRDMSRSVAFYRDILEIPLKFESPHWTELATEGCTLALHHTDEPSQSHTPNAAGSCQLDFEVADIEAFHQRMLSKGAPLHPTAKTGGFWHAGGLRRSGWNVDLHLQTQRALRTLIL